jgi:hypothetical protein
VLADQRHDAFEQLVSGFVAFAVVDRFQADGIDVYDDEGCVDAAAAVKLVAEVGQARDASAGAGERVGIGDRERFCE